MSNKNIYQKEMKKLKKHRKSYFPVMRKMLHQYENRNIIEGNIEITEKDEMLILAELVDIEYLDKTTVIVKKFFEDIDKIIYTKQYPFTPNGDYYLKMELNDLSKKIKKYKLIAYIIVGIMIIITIIIFHLY